MREGSLEDQYFDAPLNKFTFQKVAGKCYWPATQNILHNIDALKGQNRKFKVSYSLSGTILEQMEKWDRNLLDLFRQMAKTGCVEFLCETQYHSLASLFELRGEFIEQVKEHRQTIKDLLGMEPKIFRNTELLYHDGIAKEIEDLGFKAIMTEGIERILEGWKSPNYLYTPKNCKKIKVLLRNYTLSDDVGYRFSAKWWPEWPLTTEKYASWLASTPGDTINIFMDYETFGEHQWEDTGIFWFLNALPHQVLNHPNLEFNTPSEVVGKYSPRGDITVPWYETVSWADLERDPSAWIGNHMQQLNFTELKRLEDAVKKSDNAEFRRIWRLLGTSDHYYYMCTKGMGDGSVHEYFSHHGNPYDAAINYHAILSDFKEQVIKYDCEKGIKFLQGEKKPQKKGDNAARKKKAK